MSQTTTLSLYRFDRWRDRAWAISMMARARPALRRAPDIGFWKLFGSGTDEGFTPVPNLAVWGMLATWPDPQTAAARLEHTRLFQRYRARASEHWTVMLQATSVRGAWSGRAPFKLTGAGAQTPVAALTRATIRPRILGRFWRRVPDISAVIGADPNVMFKIGVGEVPWLHQVTFSIWPGPSEMAAFARRDGPHARAIQAVRDGQWFREELYARFSIAGEIGTWGGRSPLERTLR